MTFSCLSPLAPDPYSTITRHASIFAASRVDEGMNVVAQECETWFVNYNKDFHFYDESLKRIETEIARMERRTRELGRSRPSAAHQLTD